MAYQKMTPASWLTRVQKGEFDDASKAAKSMGRAAWSDRTKDKMRAFVDLHFSGGKITDKDIAAAGDDGGVPDQKPKKKRGKNKVKAAPVGKKRHPAKAETVDMIVDLEDRLKIPPDPFQDIRNTIVTTHMALSAFKMAHEADPEVNMPDEIIECVALLSACVRALMDRVPSEVRVALHEMRAEVAAMSKGLSKPKKEPVPKALRAATPAAPQKPEARLDGVPLESNKEGDELWKKLVKNTTKRSNGESKRD